MTQAGHDPRHRGVHVAGAGAREDRGQARRHLGVRRACCYEMLTGRRAFAGEDVSDTLAARRAAGAGLGRAAGRRCPPRARQLLRRCLQKDPRQRAARHRRRAPGAGGRVRDGRCRRRRHGRSVATRTTGLDRHSPSPSLVAGALAVPAVRHLRETPPPAPPETRVDIVTPATDQPASFALSPDGRQIVFVASGDGASRLWLRSLATTTAQPLAGTEGADVSLLVARQPVRRLLRRGRAEAARPRRRRAADTGPVTSRSRRDVERGRRHRVCAERNEPP